MHGIFISSIPELSALVFSQPNQDNEDGYLITKEIAELDINADFVNLSACQTAQGRLIPGEAPIGLSYAFLLAGAKSVSSTLWSIADQGTSVFMQAVYKMVKEKNISYAQAINNVKREFIEGKYGTKYRLPYYWAPFVFYGDNTCK